MKLDQFINEVISQVKNGASLCGASPSWPIAMQVKLRADGCVADSVEEIVCSADVSFWSNLMPPATSLSAVEVNHRPYSDQ